MRQYVERFVRESNAVEGIHREPFPHEIDHSIHFMQTAAITLQDLNEVQQSFAPGHRLRDVPGLDVRVGNYVAPAGGLAIRDKLADILIGANAASDPWKVHVAFEMLHPYMDGNGRTGRILWAWHMKRLGRDPFALPFLHRFYYQTLEAQS